MVDGDPLDKIERLLDALASILVATVPEEVGKLKFPTSAYALLLCYPGLAATESVPRIVIASSQLREACKQAPPDDRFLKVWSPQQFPEVASWIVDHPCGGEIAPGLS